MDSSTFNAGTAYTYETMGYKTANLGFGMEFMADGTVVSDMSEWTQVVALSIYSMSDLTTPTSDDPALGLPADADKLYRLDVLVRRDFLRADFCHLHAKCLLDHAEDLFVVVRWHIL